MATTHFIQSLLNQSFALGKFYFVDWIAMIMMFSSLYALAKKKRFGWIFGLLANVCWIIFGFMVGSIADIAANVICFIMNVWGFIQWSFHPNKVTTLPS